MPPSVANLPWCRSGMARSASPARTEPTTSIETRATARAAMMRPAEANLRRKRLSRWSVKVASVLGMERGVLKVCAEFHKVDADKGVTDVFLVPGEAAAAPGRASLKSAENPYRSLSSEM